MPCLKPVLPAEYFNASLITVNNNSVNASNFSLIRRADDSIWGYGAQLLLDEGVQVIRHSDPNAILLVTMYGLSNQQSWGYTAGTGLDPVALCKLLLYVTIPLLYDLIFARPFCSQLFGHHY